MKKLETIVLAILTVLALFGVYKLVYPGQPLGGGIPSVNPNMSHFTNPIYAGGGVVIGGGMYATSTVTAGDALTEGEFQYSVISESPGISSASLSLPVFSQTLMNLGDEDWAFIQNGTSTAGINLTITAPALSTVLQLATTSPVITPGGVAIVDCNRTSTATTTCVLY